jgi:ubiquinone/menaquinone biosynthesis C-methylase UbiE
MSETQLEKYEDAKTVHSDPFGVINRDNRNHAAKAEYIVDRADITSGDAVLEVGCGAGLHSTTYASLTGEYTGIDISPSLVARTREKLSRGDVGVADAHHTPFSSDSFDAVVGSAILHHLHDQAGALREWARITKPGGCITLMEPNYLFPKDLVTAHLVPEEKHKTEMAPWRLRDTLAELASEEATPVQSFDVRPRLYTPPWPESLHGVFDSIDGVCEQLPGIRWGSQMLEVHVEC